MTAPPRVVLACCLWLAAAPARAQEVARPETLAEAWTAALAANRRLSAARALTASADLRLAAAKAARLPTVGVEGRYTALSHAPTSLLEIPPVTVPGFDAPLDLPIEQLRLGQRTSGSYRALASLPLFTSGRIGAAVEAADAGARRSRLDEAREAIEIRLAVAEAYLDVLRAGRLLEVADSHVTRLAAHASDAANLVEQGVVATNDRLSADVALADARQQRIRAANAADIAHAVYNRLLGRPLDRPVLVEAPPPPAESGDLAALTSRALVARPELAELDQEARVWSSQASGVLATVRPQSSVDGGYTYQENRYQLYPGVWSIALNVRWTLFDGGAALAESLAARRQADAVASRRDDLRSLVALDVRRAWLDVGEARARAQVARDALVQADENLKVARDRYTAGVGTATEVLDAESLRVRSETNAAVASYDVTLAAYRLRRAVGDL